MGFYSKHGLNVDVIKTAGWAVIRDKTLNKEYDAAHMLSPMPLAITLGAGSTPIQTPCRRWRTSTARAITLAIQDKRDRKVGRVSFAVPFDYSMHNYLLRYYVAEHGSTTPTIQDPRRAPPRWWPACAPIFDVIGSRSRSTSVPSTTASFHPRSVERIVGRPSVLRLRGLARVHRRHALPTRRCSKPSSTPRPLRMRPRTAKPSPRRSRPPSSTSRSPCWADLTGTYADGLGGVKRDPNRIDFDPFPPGNPSPCGSSRR